MFKAIFVSATILATSLSVFAQESLVGDWSGGFKIVGATSRDVNVGVELKIASVEGSVVTGSAKNFGSFFHVPGTAGGITDIGLSQQPLP